tara:strand:+ start:407 stop:679 length:273 start_codon:yes stop_codon:yes gene_type:complete
VVPVQHEVLNADHRQAHLAVQQGQVQAVVHREQAQLEVQLVDLQVLDLPEALLEVLLAVQQVQALPVVLTQEVRQEEVLLLAALHKERRS